MAAPDRIQVGQTVILRKWEYAKVCHYQSADQSVQMGPTKVDLSALAGQPFGTWFQMIPGRGPGAAKSRLWGLQVTEAVPDPEAEFLSQPEADPRADTPTLKDNRHLEDVNSSQKLSKAEIETMRAEGASGQAVMASLIQNSRTFEVKTAFSQAKFIRKKSRKYHDFLQVRRPALRLLMDIQYAKDPMGVLNLRADALAQLMSQAGLRASGRFLLLEQGTQGLVVAAALERLGTTGRLVHVYQGGQPQTNGLRHMNFGPEALARLSTINLFHLRALEGGRDLAAIVRAPATREASLAAYALMQDRRMDGLVVVAKQHPLRLVLHLLDYLAPSRAFAVFCPYKEPLLETYLALKATGRAVMVTVSETWLRTHQVLPNRTHPQVMMSGGGGYLLSGIVVDNAPPEPIPEVTPPVTEAQPVAEPIPEVITPVTEAQPVAEPSPEVTPPVTEAQPVAAPEAEPAETAVDSAGSVVSPTQAAEPADSQPPPEKRLKTDA